MRTCFVQYFLCWKKNICVEVVLSQIERKCNYISYQQLLELRINSVCRFYEINKDRSYPMHAMDSVMENINMFVKKLPIDSSDQSWIVHYPNVMVARRSLNFVDQEYRRGLLNFGQAIDDDELPEYAKYTHSQYVEPRKKHGKITSV